MSFSTVTGLSHGFITVFGLNWMAHSTEGTSVIHEYSFTFVAEHTQSDQIPDGYGHSLLNEVYWTSLSSESHARPWPAVAPFRAAKSRLQLRGESLWVSVFLEDRSLWTHLGLLQTISVNRRCGSLRWEAHSIDGLPRGSTPANYWITAQTHQAATWGTLLTHSTLSQGTCTIEQAASDSPRHLIAAKITLSDQFESKPAKDLSFKICIDMLICCCDEDLHIFEVLI